MAGCGRSRSSHPATHPWAGGATGLADVEVLYNPEPQNELTNFLVKDTGGLQTVGTSAAPRDFRLPKTFNGPGILKVRSTSGAANMDISAGFDLVLVRD